MDSIPHKRCTLCGVEKPLSEFHPHKGNRDGYRNQCKACRCTYFRDRYATNADYRDHHLARNRNQRTQRYHDDPDYRAQELERVNLNKRRFHEQIRQRFNVRYQEDVTFRKYRVHLNAKRRAKKLSSGGSHTLQQWLELCAYYDHRCVRCGARSKLTRDHIVPLEKNGSDGIENIQPLCGPCNSGKGIQTIDYRQTLPPWLESGG